MKTKEKQPKITISKTSQDLLLVSIHDNCSIEYAKLIKDTYDNYINSLESNLLSDTYLEDIWFKHGRKIFDKKDFWDQILGSIYYNIKTSAFLAVGITEEDIEVDKEAVYSYYNNWITTKLEDIAANKQPKNVIYNYFNES